MIREFRVKVIKNFKFFLTVLFIMYFTVALSMAMSFENYDFLSNLTRTFIVISINMLLMMSFSFYFIDIFPVLKENLQREIESNIPYLQLISFLLSFLAFFSRSLFIISIMTSIFVYFIFSIKISRRSLYIFLLFFPILLCRDLLDFLLYLSFLVFSYPSIFFHFFQKNKFERVFLSILISLMLVSLISGYNGLYLIFLAIYLAMLILYLPKFTFTFKMVGSILMSSLFLLYLSLIGIFFTISFSTFFTISVISSILVLSQFHIFFIIRRSGIMYKYSPSALFLVPSILVTLSGFIGTLSFFGYMNYLEISLIGYSFYLILYLMNFWQVFREGKETL